MFLAGGVEVFQHHVFPAAASGPVEGALVALGLGDGSYQAPQRLVSTGIDARATAAGSTSRAWTSGTTRTNCRPFSTR